MRSDELVAAARRSSFIGNATAFTDFTDAIVLTELNDKLQTVFEDAVVKARAGYWLQEANFTVGTGARFRIPPRAVVQGLEKVEVATTTVGPYTKVSEVPIAVAQNYRTTVAQTPQVFTVIGDQVEVIPPPVAGTQVKLTYYIRPSKLMTSQSSTQGGDGVDRGRITSIASIASRIVTVNALPSDQSLPSPAAITSGQQSIDIVHPDGWHELALVGATQTFSGLNITIGGTDDLSEVQVGDYVRVADQTDWPCLPDDFHRCLADATAVKLLLEQSLNEKADALAANTGNDLIRFKSLLVPRVKAEPKTIPIFSRSRGGAPSWWRY